MLRGCASALAAASQAPQARAAFFSAVFCVWHFIKPHWDAPAVCSGAVRHGHQSGASYSAVRTPWQLADSELIMRPAVSST